MELISKLCTTLQRDEVAHAMHEDRKGQTLLPGWWSKLTSYEIDIKEQTLLPGWWYKLSMRWI